MRKTARFAGESDIVNPLDTESLSDAQADQYISLLWKALDEEKAKSCLFVDPILIKNYSDSNGDDERLFKNFDKEKFFNKRYVFPRMLVISQTWFTREQFEDFKTALIKVFRDEHEYQMESSEHSTEDERRSDSGILELIKQTCVNCNHISSVDGSKDTMNVFRDLTTTTDYAKEWVRSTSFGCVLDFSLRDYPRYLGFCIAKKFDFDNCCMIVDETTLKITENDVHRVLGMPLRANLITFLNSKSLASEWKKQFKFKKNSLRVAMTDVIRLTKNSTNVDLNFKKNFVCVLISFLIQAPCNSYIRKKLLGFCCDLDNCSNYNWCELVLRSLKNSGKFWSNDAETRYYTGSLPFILGKKVDECPLSVEYPNVKKKKKYHDSMRGPGMSAKSTADEYDWDTIEKV
ncbi:hypothetical protein ACET3Z_025563 [Daucus carota]